MKLDRKKKIQNKQTNKQNRQVQPESYDLKSQQRQTEIAIGLQNNVGKLSKQSRKIIQTI